jgi:hypothetical protein
MELFIRRTFCTALNNKAVWYIPFLDLWIVFVKIIMGSTPSKSWPGSSVGIATGYGLDGPGIESRCGRDFPHLSRPALGPTQPPVQWVPGLSTGVKSGRGVTLTPHPILVPLSWKSRAIPLLLLWAVRPVQSLSACTMVTFTFTFTPLKRGLAIRSLYVLGTTQIEERHI